MISHGLLFFPIFFCFFVIAEDIGHTFENTVDENENVCAANDETGSCTQKELKYKNYPWFKHYMKLYNAMLVDQTMDPKFVVYKKHEHAMGWGNRLRGKLSVFILGLVTDRLFLQEHQMFTDNFDPPLVPTKDGKSFVPLQWDFEEHGYICDGGLNFIFDNKELKEIGLERQKGPAHALYLDWLKEENITELFEDFDCIEHSGPSSFDARIYVNELYKKKLKTLFGTGSRMERMRQVFRFLTSRPSNILLDASKSLTDYLGFPNYKPSHRIGIQARLFFDRVKIKERLWDHLEDPQGYMYCLEKMLKKKLRKLRIKPSKGEDSPPILIYLTTDDENFRLYLKDKLKSYGNVVFPNEDVVHTSAIAQDGTNPAVTEWYVLGQTSSIMTTGSSFGTTAWGIEGEMLEIIGTPHNTWGPRLCGTYPDPSMEAERDIAWGHGGNW